MDINLTILFINQDNCIEQTKLISNKDKLIKQSEYFKSILTKGFSEMDNNELNIDLTQLNCHLSLKHIQIFFDTLLEKYEYNITNNRDVKIIMDTKLKKNDFKHSITIDYGFTKDIPIHEFYILLTLCDYFSCEEFTKKIKRYLSQYKKIFGENATVDDIEDIDDEDYLENYEPSVHENFEIILDKLVDIDPMMLTPDLTYYTYSKLAEDFLQHIYYVYLTYKQGNNLRGFKYLLDIVKQLIKKNKRITKIVPRSIIKNIELSVDEIKQFPLEDCYNLINQTDGLVTTETYIFKVYDFYDTLNYEKSNERMFKLNKQIHSDYTLNQKCIKPKEEVLKLFQEKTKGLFDNMKWDNVILTGGFIFGLLNDLSESLIGSTDIDLFTYNDDSEATAKYLLNHFSQFKPYYSVRGKVVTIIIPTFPYDIQIIPTNYTTAYDVVNSFDFSYVKTYYDGNDVYTTLDGLLSLKYATTICTPTDEDSTLSNARLYKTLLKGLSIQCNSELKNEYIKDDVIDFIAMEKSEEIQMMLYKPGSIRKLAVHLTGVEMLPLIKTYYSSGQVTMNLDNLTVKESKDNKDDYDKFSQNMIVYTDIVELVLTRQFNKFEYFACKLDDGRVINSIAFETGFCKINQIFDESESRESKGLTFSLSMNTLLENNLNNLKNVLVPLWTSYVKSLSKRYDGCVKITSNIEYDGEGDPYTRSYLKIHVPENINVYKKYSKELHALESGDTVNFKCFINLWTDKPISSRNIQLSCKFMLDSFVIKRKDKNSQVKCCDEDVSCDESYEDIDEHQSFKKGILSDYNGA